MSEDQTIRQLERAFSEDGRTPESLQARLRTLQFAHKYAPESYETNYALLHHFLSIGKANAAKEYFIIARTKAPAEKKEKLDRAIISAYAQELEVYVKIMDTDTFRQLQKTIHEQLYTLFPESPFLNVCIGKQEYFSSGEGHYTRAGKYFSAALESKIDDTLFPNIEKEKPIILTALGLCLYQCQNIQGIIDAQLQFVNPVGPKDAANHHSLLKTYGAQRLLPFYCVLALADPYVRENIVRNIGYNAIKTYRPDFGNDPCGQRMVADFAAALEQLKKAVPTRIKLVTGLFRRR